MNGADVIDTLAGLAPGSPLAAIRDRKPVTRDQAQASYRALFEPAETGDVTLQERFAVATFIAGLHAQDEAAAFYTAGLARTGPADALVGALSAEIANGRTTGPYGAYPKGPLTEEDVPGNRGSGLGLSISQRIVTLYGGSITAHNGEAGGLVVVIEFPLAG